MHLCNDALANTIEAATTPPSSLGAATTTPSHGAATTPPSLGAATTEARLVAIESNLATLSSSIGTLEREDREGGGDIDIQRESSKEANSERRRDVKR